MNVTQSCTTCGDSMSAESDDRDFVLALVENWDRMHRASCKGAPTT